MIFYGDLLQIVSYSNSRTVRRSPFFTPLLRSSVHLLGVRRGSEGILFSVGDQGPALCRLLEPPTVSSSRSLHADDGVQLNVGVSNGAFVPPKYGGTIINIVSRDTRTHEQQAEALDDVKNTAGYCLNSCYRV
nr:ABC transporter B family member 27-like [Ipomoea batatas]